MRIALAILIAIALTAPAEADASRVPIPKDVTVIYEQCPGNENAAGCVSAGGEACPNPTGCIYLNTFDRFALMHESAHAWEQQALTDSDREWFTAILGMKPQPWFSERPNHGSPGERFADAYANCAMGNGYGRRRGWWESGYGYNFEPGRHRRICNTFAVLALVGR